MNIVKLQEREEKTLERKSEMLRHTTPDPAGWHGDSRDVPAVAALQA